MWLLDISDHVFSDIDLGDCGLRIIVMALRTKLGNMEIRNWFFVKVLIVEM